MMSPLRGKLNDSQLCCLKTLGSQPDNLYFPLRQSGVGNLFDHSICRIAHFEGASPASYRQVKVKVLVSLIFCYIVLAEPKGRKLILRRRQCAFANGIPIMVMAHRRPINRWNRAISHHPVTIHIILNIVWIQPPSAIISTSLPNGQSASPASLNI